MGTMPRRTLVEMALRRAKPGTGSSQAMLLRRTAELQWPRVDLALAPVLCAVVGAVATRQYMSERRTGDIGVVVFSADADRGYQQPRTAGYEYQGQLGIGGSIWTAPDGHEVDLLEMNAPWLPRAIRDAQGNRDLQGLPILPLPYLVLMKLDSSRAQDLADISRMMGQADVSAVDETLAVVSQHAPADLADLRSLIELGRLELGGPQE